ncbi:MAG: cyclic nucleotide-binding domain-containing protein [Magnetococcales bacterium]|nr:cyclic nucleotide-binding domain-containing protein [Magnetococcales bacterium]
MLFKIREPKLGKMYPAGEIIASEGDVATHLHIVQSGLAEVYRTGFDGRRIRLTLLKAGDMFGSMALFDKKPFHSSIQALDDTWVLLIDKKAILRRIYEDPSLVLRIMENLSGRIRRQDDEILDLNNGYQAAIGGLVTLAEAARAGGGDNPVVHLVGRLGEQLIAMGCFPEILDKGYLENLKIACLFYDIGNSGLPEELRTRQGGLQEKERELLKTHIHIGSKVLTRAAEAVRGGGAHFQLAAELAQFHHEKFDGSGYLGLKGMYIPVSARIVAVVDVYSALLSDRSYRKPLTPAQAMAFIKERAGTHFDPQVTDAFVAMGSSMD